ncbi:CHAD domain-containing protein [Microlunatus antarcticus]|uniref:CHAD domain-containing protein n=1 Tax=Microlunatus antarcticus TaxID=53388 RepID=A0A7W5JUM7_9ACTN|nr:CHAD domain-containing protein [Microlunatus antarcticus]MBB3326652.1 CHAD domain-containing protein [Microlunatus antarcticus]
MTQLRALVADYLITQLTVLVDAPTHIRAGEDVTHPTRVAARRLRSTLRVFPELFEVPKAGRLDEELQWWAGVLGEVRDLDVQSGRLGAALDAVPDDLAMGPLRTQLAELVSVRRGEAVARRLEAMDSPRYRALDALLRAWRADPPFTAAADVSAKKASGYVERADRKTQKRLSSASRAYRRGAPDADELMHRARKAGKRHRYAVELAAPVLGTKADRIMASRKEFQELLGEHQDSVVAAGLLRELGALAGADGQNGFTWGLLHAREQAVAQQVVRDLRRYL